MILKIAEVLLLVIVNLIIIAVILTVIIIIGAILEIKNDPIIAVKVLWEQISGWIGGLFKE